MSQMDDLPDVATIVAGLTSDNESHRKLAAFHLQSLVATDQGFADAFAQGGDGIPALKTVVLEDNGNTLAYGLGSLTKMLEYGFGWESLGSDVIARAVELVVSRPSINVLRNALSLLVLAVSRPLSTNSSRPGTSTTSSSAPAVQPPSSPPQTFGFKTLKPLLSAHSDFLPNLVTTLSSADHALCGAALQLISALLRDALHNGDEDEWPLFLRRLQDLGIISGVEDLMRGDAVSDIVLPVLQFQDLYKDLLRRWRGVDVRVEKGEHRRALVKLQTGSFVKGGGERRRRKSSTVERSLRNLIHQTAENGDGEGEEQGRTRDYLDSWERIGFESEDPTELFDEAGLLGLMDLSAYVRDNAHGYQMALLEQGVLPFENRCPIAKASLSVTIMLYDHFDIESENASINAMLAASAGENGFDEANLEWIVQPLLLEWNRMHASALTAFLRLWTAAGATVAEFDKIDSLVRIMLTRIMGGASRKMMGEDVQRQFVQTDLATVRKWQLEDLDAVFERGWGADLRSAREDLHREAVQFMQEQRIRCLLEGAWFPSISTSSSTSGPNIPNGRPSSPTSKSGSASTAPSITGWRFVQLSPSRRHLQYTSTSTTSQKPETNPSASEFSSSPMSRIDVNNISSVVSHVSSASGEVPNVARPDHDGTASASKNSLPRIPAAGITTTTTTATDPAVNGTTTASATRLALSEARKVDPADRTTITRLTIHGTAKTTLPTESEDPVLLELQTTSSRQAAEWLDGLLMLLDQQPITADTHKMIQVIETWGLKVRMLNLEWDDVDWGRDDGDEDGSAAGVVVPSREGLDGEYWFDMGET